MSIAEDLKRIAVQERELRLPRFDSEVAWQLGTRIRSMGVERGLSLVVDVRRLGQPLFYCALEGTTGDNPEWVRRKSNVVARFQRSTYAVGLALRSRGTTLQERQGTPLADFATDGGGFPIVVENAGLVGSITVSGLTQREDHELVVEALCAHLGRDYATLKLEPESA